MGQASSAAAPRHETAFVRADLVLETDLFRLYNGRSDSDDIGAVSLFYYPTEGVKEGLSVAPFADNAQLVPRIHSFCERAWGRKVCKLRLPPPHPRPRPIHLPFE